MPGRDLKLSITAATGTQLVPYLREHLPAAHRILQSQHPCPLADLSVALVGDARMASLHHQFMHLRGPTDVLTFPLDLDPRGRPLSGEIVLCVPEARRRAAASGAPARNELLLYALHGLLHLCGFDDTTPAAFRVMHQTEDRILTQLGVGPVFATPPPAVTGKPKLQIANRKSRMAQAP
jgi:probable rRNA maturation factor